MREIKFRAWDKKHKYMDEIDGKYLYIADGKIYEVREGTWNMESFTIKKDVTDDFELMQYTGLKDKNGVEIYEGDILRVTDGADEVNVLNSDTGIGVVEWLDKWGFWNISNIENGLGDILNCGYVEIIGSIYENGEMLKGVANEG